MPAPKPVKPAPGRSGPTSRPLTPQRLENIALHYLERFATSSENLRRVLMRRVDRSVAEHGTDRVEAAGWVDALITRYLTSRLLDDALYARSRTASLHRRGTSTRAIRQKLAAKGVDADHIDQALEIRAETAADDIGPAHHAGTDMVADAPDSADMAAALALCRRRRLGPYRLEEARAPNRDRDMAALGRAGFDYETARRAVDWVFNEE